MEHDQNTDKQTKTNKEPDQTMSTISRSDLQAKLERAKQIKKHSTISFRNDQLKMQLGGLQTEEQALHYFCSVHNPFYDRTSLNETIKMQQVMRMDELKHVEGVRYEVYDSNPPDLYVIVKKKLENGKDTTMNCYFILGGLIIQAPLYLNVVYTRLHNVLYCLDQLFHDLQPNVSYSATTGEYFWNFEHGERGNEREEKWSGSGGSRAVDDDNGDNDDDEARKNRERRRVAQESMMIAQSTRPPYSNEIQLHVDKLIYDMELETHEECLRREEERTRLMQQQHAHDQSLQQQQAAEESASSMLPHNDSSALQQQQQEMLQQQQQQQQQGMKRTLSSAQVQGMGGGMGVEPQASKKTRLE